MVAEIYAKVKMTRNVRCDLKIVHVYLDNWSEEASTMVAVGSVIQQTLVEEVGDENLHLDLD